MLPPLRPSAKQTRLELARWLVDPANPLTPRVTVNWIWQRYFGRGLVATLEDVGTQGEKPSHPELLDWLASEFVRQHWSLKALHKLIVTSATYRQSSQTRPELVARDPLNVLLACDTPLRARPLADLLARFTWPAATCFATLGVIPSLFGGRMPQWLQHQARSPEVEAMVQAWAKEQQDDLRASRTRMEEFIAELPPPLRTCRSLTSEGDPVSEILAAIERENIDLLVIGSQHKRTLATAILGSTSEAVLAHAPCSVLVVPTRGVS